MKKVNFAKNLAVLRKRRGFTQEELGDRCGVSRQAVTKWESGENQPDLETITKVCSIMEVTLEELVYGTIDSHDEEINQVNMKLDDLTRMIQHFFKQREGKPTSNLYEVYLQMREDINEHEAGLIMLKEGRNAMNDSDTDKAYELFEQAISRGITSAGFELIKLFADWYESTIKMETASEVISLEVFCGKYMQVYGRILVEENMRKYGFDESIYE